MRAGFARYLPVGSVIAILLIVEIALVMLNGFGSGGLLSGEAGYPVAHGADYSNSRELGRLLYTEYVYPFEIAAIILLVAIIAAIALTMRRRPEGKYIDPASQIKVNRDDRLRIVKMDSESAGDQT